MINRESVRKYNGVKNSPQPPMPTMEWSHHLLLQLCNLFWSTVYVNPTILKVIIRKSCKKTEQVLCWMWIWCPRQYMWSGATGIPRGCYRDEIRITATRGRQSCGIKFWSSPVRVLGLVFVWVARSFTACVSEPVEGRKMTSFDQNCPISRVMYSDVTRCRIVEDSTLFIGCDLVVD